MQCLLLATPQHMRPFNPIAQTLTYNIHVAASNFRRIPCHTSISDSTSPLAMPAPLTLQLARAPQTAPQHQEQLQDLHTRMLYVHTHTHTNTHIHTHLHISVSFKGDASLFKHFASLFKGLISICMRTTMYNKSQIFGRFLGKGLRYTLFWLEHPA